MTKVDSAVWSVFRPISVFLRRRNCGGIRRRLRRPRTGWQRPRLCGRRRRGIRRGRRGFRPARVFHSELLFHALIATGRDRSSYPLSSGPVWSPLLGGGLQAVKESLLRLLPRYRGPRLSLLSCAAVDVIRTAGDATLGVVRLKEIHKRVFERIVLLVLREFSMW